MTEKQTAPTSGEEKAVATKRTGHGPQQETYVIQLGIFDCLFLSTLFVLLVLDVFFNAFVGASVLTRLIDAIDFNLGFRNRVPPVKGETAQQDHIASYELTSQRLNTLQTLYVYTSSVFIKYFGGMLLNFCYFGVLKFPSFMDVLLFNAGIILVQFSFHDVVYKKLSFHPLYASIHSLGVSVFKTRKMIKFVATGVSHGLNPLTLFGYVVLGMEFTGTVRDSEPKLYHLSWRDGFRNFENASYAKMFSFDTACDIFCTMCLLGASAVSPGMGTSSTLGLLHSMLFLLTLYRWQRKVLAKFFKLDVDVIVCSLLVHGFKNTAEAVHANAFLNNYSSIQVAITRTISQNLRGELHELASEMATFIKKLFIRLQVFAGEVNKAVTPALSTKQMKERAILKLADTATAFGMTFGMSHDANAVQNLLAGPVLMMYSLTSIQDVQGAFIFLFGLTIYDLFLICKIETLKQGGQNEHILRQYGYFWAFASVFFVAQVLQEVAFSNSEATQHVATFSLGSSLFNFIRAALLLYLAIPNKIRRDDCRENGMVVMIAAFRDYALKYRLKFNRVLNLDTGRVDGELSKTNDTSSINDEPVKQKVA